MIAQIAGSLVLLICAGLFLRTLQNAEHIDLGFGAELAQDGDGLGAAGHNKNVAQAGGEPIDQ